MNTEAAIATDQIPQRADIDKRHTWNLSDLYPDKQAWEADYTEARKLAEGARAFVGHLADSPQTMWDCLQARSELGKKLMQLYQYAHLHRDLDSRVPEYQEMNDRAAMLSSQAAAAFAFVEPELLKMDDAALRGAAAKFPKTDEYDFYIEELIRSKAHVRSEEVEEVLAMSMMVGRAPDNIFSMYDTADITYPSITDEKGNEVRLTKQRYMKLMESPDQRVRRDANAAFYQPYKEHLNTLSASLSSGVNRDVFYARSRKFDSCLEAALDADNIPLSVYHSLLKSTDAGIDVLHKWVALRKRLLKLDEFHMYDMYCPLFPEQNYEVAWDDAVRQVIESAGPLGDKYVAQLKEAFAKRWVDVFETQGKTGGAFSWGIYTCHPFVLMNYNDTVDNMFTLAHEMGHAMHSYLANSTQPYPKAHYSTFVAEVASTLNEGLLLDYLLKRITDDKQRLFLLNRQIDNTLGTFFNQVMYANFELMIHEEVEKGGALSHEVMSKMWRELLERYHGPGMTMDEMSPLKWCRIPHFYTAFYVYQYATSYAASQAILDKFLAGEAGIIEKYLTLLSSGGKDHPINLLKACGVDMSKPDAVEATIRLFGEQVDEVAKLAG